MSGRSWRTAAMVASPRVPAPMTTAERAPSRRRRRRGQGAVDGAGGRLDHDRRLVAPARRAPRAAAARGRPAPATSRRRCRRSTRSAGRAAGGRRPVARSGWCARRRTAGHGGSMPRTRQCSTGSTTTRRPSSASPTTSWPGTNGKLTIGSNHRDDRPSTVARSLPQIPASRGRTTCQSGPGRRGRVDVDQAQRAGPAAAARPPARRHPGRGEPGDRALHLQRLHDRRRRSSAGARSAAAGGALRAPWASARRASPACGRWRPAWSRG